MKALHFAAMALALLTGCGNWTTSSHTCVGRSCGSTWNGGGGLPTTAYTTFVIDSGAAIELPQATLGITTNGQGGWVLAWQGDRYQRQFNGTITCPTMCSISYARFDGAYPGDSAQITGSNQIAFQGVTSAAVPQNLLFQMSHQPVTFDLYIDGHPAIGTVVFASQGVLSTTDTMPFSLVSDNEAYVGKTEKAPSFVAKPPKDDTERSITVAAPPLDEKKQDK
jgi:hypothetical protein